MCRAMASPLGIRYLRRRPVRQTASISFSKKNSRSRTVNAHQMAVNNQLSVSPELMHQVRTALDLPDTIPTDLEGLRIVYKAWCDSMTFDNIRKFISLRSGDDQLAGAEAADYFENWLENRSGGTCWPSANAL